MRLKKGHWAPVIIRLDADTIDYLLYPWPRFLAWLMRCCANGIANGVEHHCGVPPDDNPTIVEASPVRDHIIDNPGIE